VRTIILSCLILGGCIPIDQLVTNISTVPSETLKEVGSPDGPPLIASVDYSGKAEPEPRREPLAAYGNPETYEVDGLIYRTQAVSPGFSEFGVASWYGRKFHGRLTSSGEPYDMFAFTAAHKTMQIPAWVRVTNLENNRSLVVRVNDRGPFVDNRVLDLSWAAAKRLGFDDKGTAKISYEVLVVPSEEPGLVANPLTALAQNVLQVTAVSTETQAQKIANALRKDINPSEATIRIESTGSGLFRVQVLPKTDAAVVSMIYERLISMGWSPQRLILR